MNGITKIVDFSGFVQTKAKQIKVQNYKIKNDHVTFSGTDLDGLGKYRMISDDVIDIEGMKPDNFAKAYDLTEDGIYKSPGKKRGRKPKNEIHKDE